MSKGHEIPTDRWPDAKLQALSVKLGLPLARCRACGCPIIWAHNPKTGKNVPFDARANPYTLIQVGGGGIEVYRRADDTFINHHLTCPAIINRTLPRRKCPTCGRHDGGVTVLVDGSIAYRCWKGHKWTEPNPIADDGTLAEPAKSEDQQ